MNNSTMDEQPGDFGASADADRATREPSLRLGHSASVPSAGELTTEELLEAFQYLDELRLSGRTNMWAAGLWIEEELLWPPHEAGVALGLWMKTFGDASVEARVAQAIEARSGQTEGLDPKGESAVRQDAPKGGIGD